MLLHRCNDGIEEVERIKTAHIVFLHVVVVVVVLVLVNKEMNRKRTRVENLCASKYIVDDFFPLAFVFKAKTVNGWTNNVLSDSTFTLNRRWMEQKTPKETQAHFIEYVCSMYGYCYLINAIILGSYANWSYRLSISLHWYTFLRSSFSPAHKNVHI